MSFLLVRGMGRNDGRGVGRYAFTTFVWCCAGLFQVGIVSRAASRENVKRGGLLKATTPTIRALYPEGRTLIIMLQGVLLL